LRHDFVAGVALLALHAAIGSLPEIEFNMTIGHLSGADAHTARNYMRGLPHMKYATIAFTLSVLLSTTSHDVGAAEQRQRASASPVKGVSKPYAVPQTPAASKADLESLHQAIEARFKKQDDEARQSRADLTRVVQDVTRLDATVVKPDHTGSYISFAGSITSALLAGLLGWYLARKFTLRVKMVESTLEFSKRYGDAMNLRSELNAALAVATPAQPFHNQTDSATNWWIQFFDLMLYEFDFFRQGLIWDERFAQWMKWRWNDFQEDGKARAAIPPTKSWDTLGMSYLDGWKVWSTRAPNNNNRLVNFLDTVHRASSFQEVERLVAAISPRLWSKHHLK
jgi:hypothetical protein